MKFSTLALDSDGTIAVDGVFDPAVHEAVGETRRRGIVVILVTGRWLPDLHHVAGDSTCFDVIVADNGAVLEFPANGRHAAIGHVPCQAFLQELQRRSIPFAAGESVVEADARWADPILEVIRSLEQPLILASNRGRLMVLPQAMAPSTGLREALLAPRISIHNWVGIGDAENDHDLFDACEVGVAVELAPRLTSHVRHRTKYLDMPVLDSQAFVFTGDGRPGARARTPKEFTGLLAGLPADRLVGDVRRHDFSRWIEEVFRARPLAAHLRNVEAGVETDNSRDVTDSVAQAIRGRYDTAVEGS